MLNSHASPQPKPPRRIPPPPDTSERPRVRVTFRPAAPEDLPYVLDSWRLSWRLADRCRGMRGRDYFAFWTRVVRHGVLSLPDTQVTVGCEAGRPRNILSWICHTPGPIPTVHYACTRQRDRSGHHVVRRLGLLRIGLAAIGVRDALVYTARPAERSHPTSGRVLNVEVGLLQAAALAGIAARYHSVEEFLDHRGVR